MFAFEAMIVPAAPVDCAIVPLAIDEVPTTVSLRFAITASTSEPRPSVLLP